MTALSGTFGVPDGFRLQSFIFDGKSQFRIPTAGQWVVDVLIKRDVDNTPELAHLKGKAKVVYYESSISFMVKP